jgi:hypothetical protein
MSVRLDEPHRVEYLGILVTRHLLLLEPPLRQLDFMTEQVAARVYVLQSELGPERAQAFLRLAPAGLVGQYLDLEQVVCVPVKVLEAVRRDFVLVVVFRDWWTDVVRVQLLATDCVCESDLHLVRDVLDWWFEKFFDGVVGDHRVQDEPVVVLVSVGVERNLLFCSYIKRASIPKLKRSVKIDYRHSRLLPVG